MDKTRLLKFLQRIDKDFTPYLSDKTNLYSFCEKIMDKAILLCSYNNKGDIVGLVVLYANDFENQYAYISLVGVSPDYRRQGIAEQLMKKAIDYVGSLGKGKIKRLGIHTNNPVAQHLYEKLGFIVKNNTSSRKYLEMECETINVLLTAIGSMSALCAINKLHKAGHRVIGCDIYPEAWHYEASLCDVFVQSPYAKSKDYVPFLIGLAKKENVKYIIPLTDLEIDIVNAHRNEFEKEGLVLCIPSADALSIARNKYALFETFKDDNRVLSIPTVTASSDLNQISYPCVAKPKGGRSSEGLFYLQNSEQLKNIDNLSDYLFQEKITGNVCCVDYVRDPKTGDSFCVPREELLRTKNGAGTTVKIFNDKTLENLVRYIGEKLNICGTVNMEFIKNDNGYYLIDINPRFSAGIAFSCSTGYDFINAHLSCFSDAQIPSPVIYNNHIGIKYYVEGITPPICQNELIVFSPLYDVKLLAA